MTLCSVAREKRSTMYISRKSWHIEMEMGGAAQKSRSQRPKTRERVSEIDAPGSPELFRSLF